MPALLVLGQSPVLGELLGEVAEIVVDFGSAQGLAEGCFFDFVPAAEIAELFALLFDAVDEAVEGGLLLE